MKYINILIILLIVAGPTIGKVISGLLKEWEEKQKSAKRKLNKTFGQPTVDSYNKDARINSPREELAAKRKADAQQWRELQQQRNNHRNQQSTTQTNEEWKQATQSKKGQDSRQQTRSRYSAIQETLIQAGIIQQQQPPQRQRQQQQRVRQQQQAATTSHTGTASPRRLKHVAQHQSRHLQADQQQESRYKESLPSQDKSELKPNIAKARAEQQSTKPAAAVTPSRLYFGSAGIPFNRTTLRQAIILKEILDKPIALRETPSYY